MLLTLSFLCTAQLVCGQTSAPIRYNNPGLVVDLGVGLWAWPLPMDYDRDGDLDLVVACPDKPYNGIYFFENPGGAAEMPVFKPAKRLGPAERNLQLSMVNGAPAVLSPGVVYRDFRAAALTDKEAIPLTFDFAAQHERIRANQWKYADYDGDGDQDLLVGIGDWTDYGWDNAFNERGEWTRGPLHGYVYLALNTGSDAAPQYRTPIKLEAGGRPVDVFGMPPPNLADFDGDGDLDLLCGEFLDGFTYFENRGSRREPHFAAGRPLTYLGERLRLDLQMITPVSVDWNRDGFPDLVVGDEDGRVALVRNTGQVVDGLPQFLPPRYFQQEADEVKFGALVTPVSMDWDDDGDEDLICGNTAGYIGFIENLDGGDPPRWAAPSYLEADGRPIRLMAGYNGSIQGPCEAKWGYTTLSVADWDHDGLKDLVVNSIWGKVVWYENVGSSGRPRFTAPRPLEVEWPGAPPYPAWNWWTPRGRELATQWRTTPCVLDLNGDGLNDLVMLDHEGFLAFFERRQQDGQFRLLPPQRIFKGIAYSTQDRRAFTGKDPAGQPLRLNDAEAGSSGRRKLCFTDWDRDGRIDLLVNSQNAHFLRNAGTDPDGFILLEDQGPLDTRILAGHTTSPTVVDWNQDGKPDLLIGAEDGRLYYLEWRE